MSLCHLTTLPGSTTLTISIPTIVTVQPISTFITLTTLISVPTTYTAWTTVISSATQTTTVPDPATTSLITAESITNKRRARQILIITLVLGTLGIAFLIVLVASILLFWRRRRRYSDSSPYSFGGRNTRPEAIAFPSPAGRRGGILDAERGDADASSLAKKESGEVGNQKRMDYERKVESVSPGPEAGFEFGSMGRRSTSMRNRNSNTVGTSGMRFMSALGGNPVSRDEDRGQKAMEEFTTSGLSRGIMAKRRTITDYVISTGDVGLRRASDEMERDAAKRHLSKERRGRPGWRDRYGNTGYEDDEQMNTGRQRRSGWDRKQVRSESSGTIGRALENPPASSAELKREKMISGTSTIESGADVDTRASSGIFPSGEDLERGSDWIQDGMVVHSIVR